MKENKKMTWKRNKRARFIGDGQDDGLRSVFLNIKTQEQFGLLPDENDAMKNSRRFIKREDILLDIEKNPETSDFKDLKNMIMENEEDEILVVFDPELMMGQNFYIALTEEARNMITNTQPKSSENLDRGDDDDFLLPYYPPVAMPWLSLGSEHEIADWTVVPTRAKIKLSLKRHYSLFKAATAFSVARASDDVINNNNVVDIQSSDDKLYSHVCRMELDVAVQAVAECRDTEVQKVQGSGRNKVLQCQAREMGEQEAQDEMLKPGMALFLRSVLPRIEKALQQNQILDVFIDDWSNLNQSESNVITKSDNHLKEFQSYAEMQHGKAYAVSHIEWHPSFPDVVAVSLIENLSYYDLMDEAKKQNPQPFLILFWNFFDPIHPLLRLEAPDQVTCFKFSPTNGSFVAAGCFNGQIVLWDLTCFKNRLKDGFEDKKKQKFNMEQDMDMTSLLKVGRFCALSSIENSHKAAVSQILWLPHFIETNRHGTLMVTKYEHAFQLLTSSVDQHLMFWDLRTMKGTIPGEKEVASTEVCFYNGTFKHLDLLWKPFLKVATIKAEMGTDYTPTKFLTNTHLNKGEDNKDENKGSMLFLATEDGDVLYTSWCPTKDQESGKFQAQRPVFSYNVHSGPVVALERHPSISDIVLSVGGWNFALWKEGFNHGPIFLSSFSSKHYTGGCWCNSRAAVIFLIRVDGSLDVWDLLDRTYAPIHTQTISSTQISIITTIQLSKQFNYVAIGNTNGSLHLLELPSSLTTPAPLERNRMEEYLEMERKRVVYHMHKKTSMHLDEQEEQRKQSTQGDSLMMSRMTKKKKEEEVEDEDQEEESDEQIYEKFLNLETSFMESLDVS